MGYSGTDGREALQRIVDYFDPDIIIFQEAKGTGPSDEFLAANPDYEGYYSSGDGAHNRRMIMSKYDIIDESVREYNLGEGSLRTMYAATINLPGPRNIEVFTAHWSASSASVRANESAESVSIIQAHNATEPNSLYVYAGDFNDVDTSYRITNLLDPNVGLNMFTPVDPNNHSNATINSDPEKSTYLDRRIDYVLPSDAIVSFGISGCILNTWTYTAETIPAGLELTDTIKASDHLPLYVEIDIPNPGDLDGNGEIDLIDFSLFTARWHDTGCNTLDNYCGEADINGDGKVGLVDLAEITSHWLTCYLSPESVCWKYP
ncbi:endonuclease/exonuclease/phosphatase family protein [Planctomycetota bacterium]